MNARVAQELLKVLQCVGLEIGRILVQRHGQYGLDLDIKIQGRLDHQEVCPWRHADHHVHLRVGQIRLELGDKRRNGVLEAREFRGVEIPVTRYPHDEWGISLHVRSKLIQHGSRRYGSARQIVRPPSRSAKTAASVGREFYRSAVRVASRRSTREVYSDVIRSLIEANYSVADISLPVVASLCREVAVEESRGRWIVARSATGPDDFVNGYLTPPGCFGDRARSSRAGKACDASTLLYGHAVRQRWCTSGTQNLLICLQALLWTTPKQGLRGGEQGKQVPPFPPNDPLAWSFNRPGQHRQWLRMTVMVSSLLIARIVCRIEVHGVCRTKSCDVDHNRVCPCQGEMRHATGLGVEAARRQRLCGGSLSHAAIAEVPGAGHHEGRTIIAMRVRLDCGVGRNAEADRK